MMNGVQCLLRLTEWVDNIGEWRAGMEYARRAAISRDTYGSNLYVYSKKELKKVIKSHAN